MFFLGGRCQGFLQVIWYAFRAFDEDLDQVPLVISQGPFLVVQHKMGSKTCVQVTNFQRFFRQCFFSFRGFEILNWVFPKIGVPQNGCIIMDNPIKMDDLGVPLFSETSNSWNIFYI